MRFSLDGKIYDVGSVRELSLADLLLLEQQTQRFGRAVTMADIQEWNREINALATNEERAEHQGALWMMGVAIWASRRRAGDDLEFGDAIDFPMSKIKWLPEPQDHQAAKSPRKPRAATGSARGAKRAPGKGKPRSRETSPAASSGD